VKIRQCGAIRLATACIAARSARLTVISWGQPRPKLPPNCHHNLHFGAEIPRPSPHLSHMKAKKVTKSTSDKKLKLYLSSPSRLQILLIFAWLKRDTKASAKHMLLYLYHTVCPAAARGGIEIRLDSKFQIPSHMESKHNYAEPH
jgi:hypothetical protein